MARSLPLFGAPGKSRSGLLRPVSAGRTPPPPLSKVEEEVAELRQAVAENSNVEERTGDALFSLVSLARQLDIDPEKALHKASDKFISPFFRHGEAGPRGSDFLSEAQWLELWQQAKEITSGRSE